MRSNKRNKLKSFFALILMIAMVVQTGNWGEVFAYADENNNAETSSGNAPNKKVWNGETTDEILEMIDKENLDLTTFFDAELMQGITKDDLINWKAEGKDIKDVVLERGRQRSAKLSDSYKNTKTWVDENGEIRTEVNRTPYNSPISADPNYYYLTDCIPSNVISEAGLNLKWFHSPKTGSGEAVTPWDITLGYDEVMCLTFGGNASTSAGRQYVEGNLSDLRSNPYFNGGSDYPLDAYLRGACYAYERLMNIKGGAKVFTHADGSTTTINYVLDGNGALDSNLNELYSALQRLRGASGESVVKSYDREIYHLLLQILTWRISQGDFKNWDLQTEMNVGASVIGQMTGYNEQVLKDLTQIYSYFLKCAGESATNQYNKLYTCIAVKYYAVQGADRANWQDFLSWDVQSPVVPNTEIKIDKVGNALVTGNQGGVVIKYPFASFDIYSDSACQNKLGSFTTDLNGQATLNLVEGYYYLKETKAPAGTKINPNVITLKITDAVSSIFSVNNDEIYNKVLLVKYDRTTREIIKKPAVFVLQEKIGDSYFTVAQLSYTNGEMTIGGTYIPAYSYYLSPYAEQTYHDGLGNAMLTTQHDGFFYTTANGGNFRIIEQSAPDGYLNDAKPIALTMDLNNQGALLAHHTFETGATDTPHDYTSTVQLKKFDNLSSEELKNVGFDVQEKVNNKWYKVGSLTYDATKEVYTTNVATTYTFHKEDGSVYRYSQSQYPLLATRYNNGEFKIVETKLENVHYKNTATKEYTVAKEDNHVEDMTSYFRGSNKEGIRNTGETLTVYVNKYDSVTKELISENQNTIKLELYEYNKEKSDYLPIGDLKYDAEANNYGLDKDGLYTPHSTNGDLATSLIAGTDYDAGLIYYTSANEGKFKVVETVAPTYYNLGNQKADGTVEKFEKEFSIDNDAQNNVVDFTTYDKGAIDTPINVKFGLSKFDEITKQKVSVKDAEFTVYEKINDKFYEVGKLVYDKTTDKYTSVGMTAKFHNSTGAEVQNGTVDGLYYTSANKGNYKVVETKAPSKYVLNKFEKEFNVTENDGNDINLDDITVSAKDIGFRGKLNLNKFDASTEELVRTGDMIATVFEKVNGKWLEMGTLKYNDQTKFYSTEGVDFKYHDSTGKEVIMDAADYESGWLYVTNANNGQFRVVETMAPKNYTLVDLIMSQVKFSKEFTVTKNNQTFTYADMLTAVKNFGVKVNVNLQKYDEITKQKVSLKDAEFEIQEFLTDKNDWVKVGTLKYDATNDCYTSNGATISLHNKDGKVTATNDKGLLYYTTQNLGKFKLVETKAPSNYKNNGFVKEFDISTSAKDGKVSFDDFENGAKDIGFNETVEVAKFDKITKEKVENGDAEFTVYENVNGNWIESGKLVWNEESKTYVSNGVNFVFHNTDGTVIDTKDIKDFENGKLYYTSANNGKFKVVETKAPTNYTQEPLSNEEKKIFEKEFTVDKDGQKNAYVTDDAAQNLGVYANVDLLKYDSITKQNISFGDAVFTVQENINGNWIDVGNLVYDKATKTYTTSGINVTLHNSKSENVYQNTDGRLYYTSANKGNYRVTETKAPKNYVIGEFSSEFNVLDTDNNKIDLTSIIKAPEDLGNRATVSVKKYDTLTNELVRNGDAVFTVYENVNGKWLKSGNLVWNEKTKTYVSTGVKFVFHGTDGKAIDTKDIKGFENGKLYFTSVNNGKFKVKETKAPTDYTIGTFEKSFTISKDNSSFNYTTTSNGAKNEGIKAPAEVKKYDNLTKELVKNKNTIFTVEEHIADTDKWLTVGTLKYNADKDAYTTDGIEMTYHTSSETELAKVTGNDLIYTSANGGKFRITETKAPTNYKNNGYIKEFDITTDVNADGIVAFDDFENGAKDTGVTGSTKVAKFDKVTGEKVLSGDAEFTVYENVNGNWIESGKLVYDEPTQTYVANGVKFVFHNADGTVIDSEDIKAGKLYYTTVNDGKFKVVETKAPQFYNLDGFEKEFDITVKADNDYSSKENGAMDTGYKGNAKLVKVDRETNAKLSGAVFEVQEWNETEQNWLSVGNLSDLGNGNYTTDDMKVALHTADGNSVETNELNYTTQNLGKYRIVEVKAPEGYLNDNYESNIIEITENDKVADFTTDDVNAKDTPVKVEISKKSVTNGSDIIGAELIVTDENGKEIDKWVTDGTSHLISAIKPGKYTLTENKAPEGYVISSSIDFTVEETGDIQKVEMYDDIVRGKVVLTKTDKDTGNVLANAEFELRDEEGNVIETLVTDKDGKAESKEIFFGNYAENGKYEGSKKYTLVETKAPAGYVLDSTEIPVEFTYENDTTPVVVTEISNKNTPIKVSISKTSITTGKPVIGATLKITDENGKEIDKWVTDGKEHILSAIPTGKYTLVEERASDGYIVANSIDFEVMETGEIQTVVMQDEEVKGHVIIHKTDKESGKPLANAVFEIRDEDGKVVDTLTTDENGNATSKDIAFGIYDEAGLYKGSHKYTIVEVKAPEGYKLDGTVTEFEFEYKDDTTPVVVKELSFTNEKTPSVTTTPPTIVKTPTPKTSTPKTGDSVNVMIILLIALAVIGVFISALLKGRTN